MVKVFIDAGHGGSDPGAVGNGLKEKDLTLKLAKKVEALLKNYQDVQTKMSRTGDTYPSLSDRTNEANKWGADYFLSLHINAGGGTGYEDFVFTGSSKSIAYQNIMHAEIIKSIGNMKNRGKKQANYQVLRNTMMPALLTECGFIDNAFDTALLKQESFLDGLAQGHVNGLVKAFGLIHIKKEVDEEVKGTTKGLFRIKTGTFPNARAFADAIDNLKNDFGMVIYEAADTTSFNPNYRIYTGTFTAKEAAEDAQAKIKAKYGWTTYLIDETK